MSGGRVAWVTGAGSGIGRSAALAARAAGWQTALTGRRAEPLEETARLGSGGLVLPGDVTAADFADRCVDAVLDRFGRLDAIVLAAGLNTKRRFWADLDMTAFAEIVETNLIAASRSVRAALPALREARGAIVVVSSYSAWSFAAGAGVAYSASKTALAAVCATVNDQEARHGVRATHLCPGDVATDFLDHRPNAPTAASRGEMLTPDDVARAIQFVLDSPAHVRFDELVLTPVP